MADSPNSQTKTDLFGEKPVADGHDTLLNDSDFPGVEGEGSYDATRTYNERVKRFLDEHGAEVDKMAHDAAKALDGPEAETLTDAENEGLKKSRH